MKKLYVVQLNYLILLYNTLKQKFCTEAAIKWKTLPGVQKKVIFTNLVYKQYFVDEAIIKMEEYKNELKFWEDQMITKEKYHLIILPASRFKKIT